MRSEADDQRERETLSATVADLPEPVIEAGERKSCPIATQRIELSHAIANQIGSPGIGARCHRLSRGGLEQCRGMEAADHGHDRTRGGGAGLGENRAHLRLARQRAVAFQLRRIGRGPDAGAIARDIGEEALPIGIGDASLEQLVPHFVAITAP